MRITNRDLIMFKYLFEEKHIFIDDLLDFMELKYESSKRRRLSKLKKNGYIKYEGDPVNYKHFVFPTKKAKTVYEIKYKELKNEVKMRSNSLIKYVDPDKYKIADSIDINSYIHDRKLTQLRFKMEEMGVDYWQTETTYYNKYKKNPDAIFELSNRKYAVEFERTFKDKNRYKKIFEKYSKVEKIDFSSIIYFTTEKEIFERLYSLIKNISVAGIDYNGWQKEYRLAELDDFLVDDRFLVYKAYIDEWNELTDKMKKYVKNKRKN